MRWEPTSEEVEEKLIELAYTWGDIEEELELATDDIPFTKEDELAKLIAQAFRVEVVYGDNDWADPCTYYVLLYDVANSNGREAARQLKALSSTLHKLIVERADPWHTRDNLMIRVVAMSTPVEGQICRRLGESHPSVPGASLEDVPIDKPLGGAVELIEKDGYSLTPIELPFYDALRETGLAFAVQPWIQGTDRRYRVDFLVFYDGEVVAVELDGHDWHKTKEQRSRDAERDRWFQARKVRTIRWTGSQVFADPQACVSELLNVLRAAPASP